MTVQKVYFLQRPMHRKRQRETVEHCPAGIEALVPDMSVGFTKDTEIFKKHRAFVGRVKTFLLKLLYPINIRLVKKKSLEAAGLLYSWGFFPYGTKKPYVIELDTPYVMTLYNLITFRLFKPLLRLILLSKRCHRIICISEACKRTLETELGPKVASKALVVYPYIQDRNLPEKSLDSGEVNFLFVSTQFYLKGGRELLKAFEKLVIDFPLANLTLVTNLPSELKAIYEAKTWLRVVPANLDKNILQEKYFAKANVFVMPTYQDSFGLVILEALSFGLPIIATHMYAIPEMVKDNVNGFLFDPPLEYYQNDGRANYSFWKKDLAEYTEDHAFDQVEENLLECLKKLMDSNLRRSMRSESKKLFDSKFSEKKRAASFIKAVALSTL